MKINDALAVITGGASGLGLAVARHLVAAGGRVALLDVQEGLGRVAVDELGPDATFQRCDVPG
jgi:NAD(P)-dependent dehydrogenase (short-subunit alcohol dehydrogenase family)